MRDFLYFEKAGVLLRVEDISAVFFDETREGDEFITVEMKRNNATYNIPVAHADFLHAPREALGEPDGGKPHQ